MDLFGSSTRKPRDPRQRPEELRFAHARMLALAELPFKEEQVPNRLGSPVVILKLKAYSHVRVLGFHLLLSIRPFSAGLNKLETKLHDCSKDW